MAGPSYEASAPYFERYIEQEIENFNVFPRLSTMLTIIMEMYPEILSLVNT